MGGSAFSAHNPPLPTPRMPPEIYQKILSQTLALLKQYYDSCASPIEGPGKQDFGDIDILVSSPKTVEYDAFHKENEISSKTGIQTPMWSVAEKLKVLLGAEAVIIEKGNPTVNFAIPWPEEDITSNSSSKNSNDQTKVPEKKYIQIDIHHLPTPSLFTWTLFHQAHSDLWNILGATMRPFGLTANATGLYLRIPEIEALDKKKSLVFLSDRPGEVLGFLGLDEGRWWSEFEGREEMFRYAMGCRMFWVKEEKVEVEGDGQVKEGGKEGGDGGKGVLKHNDRQRMNKRPIFAAWIEEFIPKIRVEGGAREAKVTRDEITEEALGKFGVKGEWEKRVREWRVERNRYELGRVIKGAVPESGVEGMDNLVRSAAIRVLREVIKDGQDFDGRVPEVSKTNEEGLFDLEKVKEFVEGNWKGAGDIGMQRLRAQSAGYFKKKKAEEGVGVGKDTPVEELNT